MAALAARLAATVAAALVPALVVAGIVGAHGGDTGQAHACADHPAQMVPPGNECLTAMSVDWPLAGQAGPSGPTGPAGPAGPEGPVGPAGGELTFQEVTAKDDGKAFEKDVVVRCPEGSHIVGGGWDTSKAPRVVVLRSEPTVDMKGWFVTAQAYVFGDPWTLAAKAVCTKHPALPPDAVPSPTGAPIRIRTKPPCGVVCAPPLMTISAVIADGLPTVITVPPRRPTVKVSLFVPRRAVVAAAATSSGRLVRIGSTVRRRARKGVASMLVRIGKRPARRLRRQRRVRAVVVIQVGRRTYRRAVTLRR